MPDFHVAFRNLLHARKSTTWDRRLYFPSEGRRAEDFFALKNPTASVVFEPANLGTKGQHATSRPPKPLRHVLALYTYRRLSVSCYSQTRIYFTKSGTASVPGKRYWNLGHLDHRNSYHLSCTRIYVQVISRVNKWRVYFKCEVLWLNVIPDGLRLVCVE